MPTFGDAIRIKMYIFYLCTIVGEIGVRPKHPSDRCTCCSKFEVTDLDISKWFLFLIIVILTFRCNRNQRSGLPK